MCVSISGRRQQVDLLGRSSSHVEGLAQSECGLVALQEKGASKMVPFCDVTQQPHTIVCMHAYFQLPPDCICQHTHTPTRKITHELTMSLSRCYFGGCTTYTGPEHHRVQSTRLLLNLTGLVGILPQPRHSSRPRGYWYLHVLLL